MRLRLGLLAAVLVAVAGAGTPSGRSSAGRTAVFGGESKWSPLAATVAALIRRHASA